MPGTACSECAGVIGAAGVRLGRADAAGAGCAPEPKRLGGAGTPAPGAGCGADGLRSLGGSAIAAQLSAAGRSSAAGAATGTAGGCRGGRGAVTGVALADRRSHEPRPPLDLAGRMSMAGRPRCGGAGAGCTSGTVGAATDGAMVTAAGEVGGRPSLASSLSSDRAPGSGSVRLARGGVADGVGWATNTDGGWAGAAGAVSGAAAAGGVGVADAVRTVGWGWTAKTDGGSASVSGAAGVR